MSSIFDRDGDNEGLTPADDLGDVHAQTLEENLENARERLASARNALERADQMADQAHEMGGGIPGFGGSGSQRAARQVRSAWGSADRAWREATERIEYWKDRVRRYELRLAERDRVRLTRDDIAGAKLVRTKHGWHRVARVNAKSVSVETGYSWTDRYAFDQVLEVSR